MSRLRGDLQIKVGGGEGRERVASFKSLTDRFGKHIMNLEQPGKGDFDGTFFADSSVHKDDKTARYEDRHCAHLCDDQAAELESARIQLL